MSGAKRTQWGWHQLDRRHAQDLVRAAQIRSGDLVIDVGAGAGSITAPLLDAGARVIAVELHPQRVERLRARFADRRVVIVQADAADLRLPTRPFHVVANPPFSITMALLRRLLAPRSRLVRADIVLPRHAVERWASLRAPGARRWSATFDVRVGRAVPRSAFTPHAPAAAAVLVIERRPTERRQTRP